MGSANLDTWLFLNLKVVFTTEAQRHGEYLCSYRIEARRTRFNLSTDDSELNILKNFSVFSVPLW